MGKLKQREVLTRRTQGDVGDGKDNLQAFAL